ncbi:DNA ligase-1 [Paenibacillus sp. GP183]|nr:RNA ligase family protein [Paenibacillus sp. GP183]SED15169.1 DNA ligase-1 [Paenibacillus sp. GP183]
MFISPMLLEKSDAPFNDPAYLFEPKIDGHRLIMTYKKGETRLFTRHNNECTRKYPELWNPAMSGDDVILDGEVCSIDPTTGVIDFESVMERFQLSKQTKINAVARTMPVHYIVFDVLRHNGRDLRRLPLIKRKSILESIIKPNPFLSVIPYTENNGTDLYSVICDKKMEGIVAKRKNSLYVSKRSSDWLKIVRYEAAEVFISGYRKDEFGLLVQVEENGKKRAAGIIELGVPPKHKKAFYGIAKQLVTGEDKNFVYIEPSLKAKVKFRNWTKTFYLWTYKSTVSNTRS